MIRRNTTPVCMRNYGRIIQDMVALAAKEQDITKQHQMTVYIAQCMRQKNAVWNKEQESGTERLKDDIRVLSHGALACDFPEFDILMQRLQQRPIATLDSKPNTFQKKKKK